MFRRFQHRQGQSPEALMRAVMTLLITLFALAGCKPKAENEYTRLTTAARNYYEKGEVDKAVPLLEQALALKPADPDANLNLAVAALAAGQAEKASKQARAVLQKDADSAAAHYIAGCALLRLGQAKPAVQALQDSKGIDRTVNAVTFQLGRAYQQLAQYREAAQEYQELLQFEPEHPAANYTLSQVLNQLGQTNEAAQALAQHQKILAAKKGVAVAPPYEQCKYTQIRFPFQLEQPASQPLPVKFVDASAAAFGNAASSYRGPAATVDFNHDGRNHLFVSEGGTGWRLLANSNGVFSPSGRMLTNLPGVHYTRSLVGDMNNDQVDEILILGDKGSQLFKFTTNGAVSDLSAFALVRNLAATNGLLADLEFSSKLDLLAITAGETLQPYRNLGQPYFIENATNFPVLKSYSGVRQIFMDDWNSDDLNDLFILRDKQAPELLVRERGGSFVATNTPAQWPKGSIMAVGDISNDLLPDMVIASEGQLVCLPHGGGEGQKIQLGNWPVRCLLLVDYDNDGWLDIIAGAAGLRAWRNRGAAGFQEMTRELGLAELTKMAVQSILDADFDNDGDTDLLLTQNDGALRLGRNDGGNANKQVKVRLIGSQSNGSGLGSRLEVNAGGLRLARRVNTLPIEIGVGKHDQLESLTARWGSLNLNYVDVKVEPQSLVVMQEASIREGSCPFLYAWDGKKFRFVTDMLGAAPLGLPVAQGRYVEADPREYIWLGNEAAFPARNGDYELRITEELKEVLYLDEAKLVVVEHPPGTEVHTTSKMMPGKPFVPHELMTLQKPRKVLGAIDGNGQEVAGLLHDIDQRFVSPPTIRIPQLCGLAEPHSLSLDFGPLETEKPLVLALTGWLRFGGGSVNICASHDPALPFPFPKLEVEMDGGKWVQVGVVVGVPAGKTKTMLVDLAGKLPKGSRRLRLSTAFELHWDRIVLFERSASIETTITYVYPSKADMHWHGFGEYEEWPWYLPLTPSYERVQASPLWAITPTGWCTRYGEVGPLIHDSDNALALVNGGDELSLSFPVKQLPPKPAGKERDFFLYVVGWDKDANFNCQLGWMVEPLPWHGMDSQKYGSEERPKFSSDRLMEEYTIRWVGPRMVVRKGNKPSAPKSF